LVVDPWKKTVYTKQEFLLVNSPANFYGLNDHIQGGTEISGQKLDFANHPYLCKGLYLSV
jgi:hypothetical protein